MGTRGVWSLDNVENKYPQDDWTSFDSIYVDGKISKPNAGWIGGGSQPKLDKIAFDTDTRTNYGYNWQWSSPNTFNGRGVWASGTAGATHGYFSGGSNSAGWPYIQFHSFMTKLVYSTGVPLTSPSNSISSPRTCMAAASADTAGYLLGGSVYPGSPGSNMPYDNTNDTKLSIVDKITNSTDTCARVPAADLPSAQTKKAMAASAATPSFAYISGGITPIVSTAARFTYSTETVTQTPSANNLTARSYHTASSDGSTNFYWHGGGITNKTIADATPAVNYMTSSTEKTVMSTDTTTAIPANGEGYGASRATTGNSTHAYSFGGGTPYGTGANADKMTYSTETKAANPSLNLQASWGPTDISPVKGLSSSSPTGYTENWIDGTAYYTGNDGIWFGCGFNNHPRTAAGTAVDKMDFSSETMSQSTTVSDIIQGSQAASSNTKGYFFNGLFGAPGTPVSWIHKYDYASDTMEKLSTYTGNASWRGTTWDSSTASYMNLGSGNVHKLNYSNDTTSQTPSFGSIIGNATGVSNIGGGCGFAFGGSPAPGPGYDSSSNKLTWSTETLTYLPSSSDYVNEGAILMETLGAPTAGYVSYGYMGPYRSDLNKFHYSSETFEALTSFVNHGWGPPFGGAIQPWNPPNTRPYCNDNRGGTGNKTQGYLAGGVAGDESYYAGSWIDKVTYSTDTLSTLPGTNAGWNPSNVPGPLKYLRGYGAASAAESNRSIPPLSTPTPSQFGNVNAYPSGGYSSSSTSFTKIDKIDMSTDTGTPSIGFVPTQRQNHASCSNTEKGYWAGGTTGEWNPKLTSIDKFVYSTETASLIPSQLTNPDTHSVRGGGNNTIAYVSGGPSVMRWDKMPYSTETVAGLPYLPGGRYYHNMWGNQTQGYLGGGYPHPVLSTVTKVTYSTDATSSTTNLPQGEREASCTSTSTNAYIWGGYLMPGSSYKSLTSKWVMSNDTVANIPGANLLKNQVKGTSAGTPTGALSIDGWGSPYPTVAGHKTQRLTYSTDTWAGVPVLPWDNKSASAAINPNQSGNPGLSPNII